MRRIIAFSLILTPVMLPDSWQRTIVYLTGYFQLTFVSSLVFVSDVISSEGTAAYVNWVKLDSMPGLQQPCAREMHGSAVHQGSLYITGGRTNDKLLSDTWMLTRTAPTETAQGVPPLIWIRRPDLDLPVPRCAHGCAAVPTLSSSLASSPSADTLQSQANSEPIDGLHDVARESDSCDVAYLCAVGGFSEAGIVSDFIAVPLTTHPKPHSNGSTPSPTSPAWSSMGSLHDPIEPRFGLSACPAPTWLLETFVDNGYVARRSSLMPFATQAHRSLPAPAAPSLTAGERGSSPPQGIVIAGLLVFGGVDAETDFSDLTLVALQESE